MLESLGAIAHEIRQKNKVDGRGGRDTDNLIIPSIFLSQLTNNSHNRYLLFCSASKS